MSLMSGFSGSTLLEPSICAKPSDFEVGLEKKREKTVEGVGLRGMSV